MLEQVLNERMWVKEGKYQIVNEIIGIVGRKVLRSLISDIQCQKFFDLMADVTQDISKRAVSGLLEVGYRELCCTRRHGWTCSAQQTLFIKH